MKTLWILALCCLAVLLVDAKKGQHHRLFKWKFSNHAKKNLTKKPKENVNCTVLPSRLLDWFHILRAAHTKELMKTKGLPLPKLGEVIPHMKLTEAKMPFPGPEQETCREPIRFVFHNVFDQNKDGVLDDSELADVYAIEPCMKGFFKECAKGKETFTESELCHCFTTVEPPCFHKLRTKLPYLMVRGETRPFPGTHVPSCDQDGYYLPRQCKTVDAQGNEDCWCVDRHGNKMEGMTECVDNTEPPAEEEQEEPAN